MRYPEFRGPKFPQKSGVPGVPCHLLSHWHPHPMPRRVTGPENETGYGYVSKKLWDPGVTSPNLDVIKKHVQPSFVCVADFEDYTWFYHCPPLLIGFEPFPCFPQLWNHALAIAQCCARRKRSVRHKKQRPQRRTVAFHPVGVSQMSEGLVDDEHVFFAWIRSSVGVLDTVICQWN